MTEFYHPYQFVPVTGKINGKPSARLPYADIAAGKPDVVARHDLWQQGTLSGRLICSVTLKTPTFIGQKRTKDASDHHPAEVEGYKRRVDGKEVYILPGSSLRGMVGAVAEVLSQSAMRVLEDRKLSVRKEVGQSLPALGRVVQCVKKEGFAEYAIQPMTFATQWEFKQGAFSIPQKWQRWYQGRSLQKVLPVYLNGYRTTGPTGKKYLEYQPGSFLGVNQPDAFPGNDPSVNGFYYAKLSTDIAEYTAEQRIPDDVTGLYIKENRNGRRFLIGQRLMDEPDNLLDEEHYEKLSSTEKKQYTKGVLRVMDVIAHSHTVPLTKKHELFLPWPDDLEVDGKKTRLIAIRQEAENTYNLLSKDARQRDDTLPVLLKGYQSAKLSKDKLFYFDLHEKGGVGELSLSAIWRHQLNDSIHGFFNHLSPDLLPWSKERSKLTPVEALWGAVQSDKDDAQKSSANLASRLRFADALPAGDVSAESQVGKAVTLKVLSSPKPPSPAMYFNDGSSRLIKKQDLQAGKHRPNGRKVYLHHPPMLDGDQKATPWETSNTKENLKQKARVRPLQANQTFHFHIDFENLSEAELGLLLTSIQPEQGYLHRLGMGKAFGLGSVRLEAEGLFLVNRLERYQLTGLDAARYGEAWVNTPDSPGQWQQRHAVEREACGNARILSELKLSSELVDSDTLRSIGACGNPQHMKRAVPVQYPLSDSQAGETEGFKWFVNNTPSRQSDPPGVALGSVNNGNIPRLKTN
ncbi:TIGR03986 family type III CRISPR-associated RAMP protein [Thiothrix eikelboomii]|uniref:TIGR03986 family type III CRISPR-associated RAMP protein n=1 Tax=Thiothrix eikelboomii TaxID=92487 RepID=UPI003BAF7EB2